MKKAIRILIHKWSDKNIGRYSYVIQEFLIDLAGLEAMFDEFFGTIEEEEFKAEEVE